VTAAGAGTAAARGRRRGLASLVGVAALLSGCAELVSYAEGLSDPRSGRTLFVRTPATVGGFVGFGLGLPLSAAALPVTYGLHRSQSRRNPGQADALSTLLWPSFVLWRAGALIAAPFDAVEWAGWRAWRDPPALSGGEREAREAEIDADILPSYPVVPIYPEAEG
jgi:hypothetical protein